MLLYCMSYVQINTIILLNVKSFNRSSVGCSIPYSQNLNSTWKKRFGEEVDESLIYIVSVERVLQMEDFKEVSCYFFYSFSQPFVSRIISMRCEVSTIWKEKRKQVLSFLLPRPYKEVSYWTAKLLSNIYFRSVHGSVLPIIKVHNPTLFGTLQKN